jgi:lactoylglutathione lyase
MLKGRHHDHIGVATKDLKATTDWYVNVLGFELFGEFAAPDGTLCNFLKGKDLVYEVFQPTGGISPAVEGKVDHIAYKSDDIERDYKYCMEKGLKCTTGGIQTIESFWERGCRYFKIASSTGEEVEFSQIL